MLHTGKAALGPHTIEALGWGEHAGLSRAGDGCRLEGALVQGLRQFLSRRQPC